MVLTPSGSQPADPSEPKRVAGRRKCLWKGMLRKAGRVSIRISGAGSSAWLRRRCTLKQLIVEKYLV